MGWLRDFHDNGPDESKLDYGDRGFVLPNGYYFRAKNGEDHPKTAENAVLEREQYLKAYNLMKQKMDINYFNFLLLLGCIMTDNGLGTYGATIIDNAVLSNVARADIERYNRQQHREVLHEQGDENKIKALKQIWEDLTKGKTTKNGSR